MKASTRVLIFGSVTMIAGITMVFKDHAFVGMVLALFGLMAGCVSGIMAEGE